MNMKGTPIVSLNTDTTKFAFAIFALCLIVRSLLQMFGGPDVGDVSWITTFGAIGASWIGIGGQIEVLRNKVSKVEQNTNGALTAKFTEVAETAAHTAVQKAIENPSLPTVSSPVTPEPAPITTPHPGVR